MQTNKPGSMTALRICAGAVVMGTIMGIAGLMWEISYDTGTTWVGMVGVWLVIGGVVGAIAAKAAPILKRRTAHARIQQLQEMVGMGALTQAEFEAKATELKRHFL